jgi:hypothetical protein
MKKNNKEPIVVYWAPNVMYWNLFYPDPKNLFESLVEQKNNDRGNNTFFSCPAFGNKTKNTYVYHFPMDVEYEWDFSNKENKIFKPVNDKNPFIGFNISRPATINNSPQIELNLFYLFFCEEPLEATFSAPYFSKPNYTKYGSVTPGTMDIGQWFRPYTTEMTLWDEKGTINFKNEEPLFYVEFLTDRPVILKRFNTTEKILECAQACSRSATEWSARIPLIDRYKRFNDSKMNKIIIKEIKDNLL